MIDPANPNKPIVVWFRWPMKKNSYLALLYLKEFIFTLILAMHSTIIDYFLKKITLTRFLQKKVKNVVLNLKESRKPGQDECDETNLETRTAEICARKLKSKLEGFLQSKIVLRTFWENFTPRQTSHWQVRWTVNQGYRRAAIFPHFSAQWWYQGLVFLKKTSADLIIF